MLFRFSIYAMTGQRRFKAPADLPARLSMSSQFHRLAGLIASAIARQRNAGELQAAAARQLDLAQYGLKKLIDDLAFAIDIPARPLAVPVYANYAQPARFVAASSLAA